MAERTILLVEDNPYDIELTLESFKSNRINNKIVIARDGEEALDYMFGTGEYEGRDVSDIPQVVLLDLKLPKVDGLEVLKEIRDNEKTRFVPIVILTSSREQEDMLESYESGCNAYMRKPVDFQQFTEAVKTLGLFWMVLNESIYNPRQ